MSTAVEQSGLADVIAGTIVDAVGRLGPAAILAVIFVVGMLLTQVLTGIPATLIMIPITLSVAKTVGVSPVPLLMGVLIGCSAAFLTPVAAPANAIIMGPGGYRFMDYLKLGLPVTIVFPRSRHLHTAVLALLTPRPGSPWRGKFSADFGDRLAEVVG
ncbi:hypothetical protein NIIDMKKI_14050 [Mycobacterium kansasii]|uniref:Citrate transporter-like domain-containing protein n=1 Tax=Mycobacterium kansasii TaxID=1768 RepID=A0A7G1I9K0_MYCKA|nr:hypothetical protein NIIDMKKI_14050 [Mycobacterium kansasii]